MKKGFALTGMIVFTTVAITIIVALTVVAANNVKSTSRISIGEEAYYLAEAGAEEALLRIERDPTYTGGSLSIDGYPVTVSVSGSGTLTIVSEAVSNGFARKVQVVANYSNNTLTISTWKEI